MDRDEMMKIPPVNPLVSEALGWYNKAIEKVAKRYFGALGTKREQGYIDAHNKFTELENQIDVVYVEYLSGEKDIDDFKDSIRVWFKKIMSEWTDVDSRSRDRLPRKEKADDRKSGNLFSMRI